MKAIETKPDNVYLKDASCSLTTEEWFTTKEAAKYLKISEAALRNLASRRKILYYKFFRSNRYKKSDLDQLLSANKRGVLYGN